MRKYGILGNIVYQKVGQLEAAVKVTPEESHCWWLGVIGLNCSKECMSKYLYSSKAVRIFVFGDVLGPDGSKRLKEEDLKNARRDTNSLVRLVIQCRKPHSSTLSHRVRCDPADSNLNQIQC